MLVDVQNYKVVYDGRVMRALQADMIFAEDLNEDKVKFKPKFLTVTYIDEDLNIALMQDEAWRFQFVPIKDGA